MIILGNIIIIIILWRYSQAIQAIFLLIRKHQNKQKVTAVHYSMKQLSIIPLEFSLLFFVPHIILGDIIIIIILWRYSQATQQSSFLLKSTKISKKPLQYITVRIYIYISAVHGTIQKLSIIPLEISLFFST